MKSLPKAPFTEGIVILRVSEESHTRTNVKWGGILGGFRSITLLQLNFQNFHFIGFQHNLKRCSQETADYVECTGS